jgi:hypothetical protein
MMKINMNSPSNNSNSSSNYLKARLLLSGSRGVGAIHAATATSGSTLEIFDLEDHENSDNESDAEVEEDVDTSMEVD